jgi:hypothetical protein
MSELQYYYVRYDDGETDIKGYVAKKEDVKAAIAQARREERERLARLFEDTSNRLAWAPQEIADTIRQDSIPEEEPKPDWEGFGRAIMESWPYADVEGGELQDTAEYFGLLRREPGGYDPEKHGEDFADICEPGDEFFVPTYPVNRRASTTSTDARHTGEPGTLDELSDVERQECGYPATREMLAWALRQVHVMEYSDNDTQERRELMSQIGDILSREEP